MPAYPEDQRRVVRFGVFEADLHKREVRRHGIRIKLQEQPFQVLATLLEAHGEVVTRARLRDELWPDTNVDFEESLNAAVRRLRIALGDTAGVSRYIETVPRQGYRFAAPVDAEPAPNVRPLLVPVRAATPRPTWGWRKQVAALGAVFVVLSLLTVVSRPASLGVKSIAPITTAGGVDDWARPVSDGPRVYFLQRKGGSWITSQVAASGGDPQPMNLPFHDGNVRVLDTSPDGSMLLVGIFTRRDDQMPLWIAPAVGGPARRLDDIMALDASWEPDGREIACSTGHRVRVISVDGSESRTVATLAGTATDLAWSPDGRRLRFSILDPAAAAPGRLWEVHADGSGLRPVLAGWKPGAGLFSGSWTPDGRFYVFGVWERAAGNSVWAVRDDDAWPWIWSGSPVQLAGGPMNFAAATATHDGHRLIAVGGESRSELARYNTAKGVFEPCPLPRPVIDSELG